LPTNRTTRARPTRRRIDAQTLRLWREIVALYENPAARESREFGDLNVALCARLGLKWSFMRWPILCGPEVPDYLQHNAMQADAWRAAHRWRCLLIEAAARS
jgi:hypothetical protein